MNATVSKIEEEGGDKTSKSMANHFKILGRSHAIASNKRPSANRLGEW